MSLLFLLTRILFSNYHILGILGNGIYVSISNEGSDTPVTRPETDKAGQSPRDRKRGGGVF